MSAPQFRDATRADLTGLIAMLADDPLGATRERIEVPLPAAYEAAFEAIDSDPNHRLIVCESEGELAGVLQLSYLPNLTYVGRWRAQIEGVRIAAGHRGKGLGRAMLEYAIDQARQRGCYLVQLTTDKKRPRAAAFYESLGFVASHEGMKMRIEE